MMLKTHFYFFIALLLLTSSCRNNTRTNELERRENALSQREKEVASIMDEYNQLLLMRDSLKYTDSLQVDSIQNKSTWTDQLVGDWESRLVCVSTSCRGYVIGDQRTEHWTFEADSTGLELHIARKAADPKIYLTRASESKNDLTLIDKNANSSKSTSLLSFEDINGKQIRGQKRSSGSGNCELIFSVLLTPRSK